MYASLLASVQLVYQPRVDRPEGASAFVVCLLNSLDVFVEPEELHAGGVGGERETAELGQLLCTFPLLQLPPDARRARIGPDNGIVGGLAGVGIPADSGFSLVRNANRPDVFLFMAQFKKFLRGFVYTL